MLRCIICIVFHRCTIQIVSDRDHRLYFFIFLHRVERSIPRSPAARTRLPPHRSRASRIRSRSGLKGSAGNAVHAVPLSFVSVFLSSMPASSRSLGYRARLSSSFVSILPSPSTRALSAIFPSSRMFPIKGYWYSSSRASGSVTGAFTPISWQSFPSRWQNRNSTSRSLCLKGGRNSRSTSSRYIRSFRNPPSSDSLVMLLLVADRIRTSISMTLLSPMRRTCFS